MKIRALSASQAERFDPEQVGGCKRRWYFQNVMRLEVPEPEESKNDGHAGHALFATHYRFEGLPKRSRMLKAVRGAIAKSDLPAPAPDMLIESRFDGQPSNTGERLPLRTESTLWLGGVAWDGYVDLRFHRAGTITVLDHKFSSDIHAYAKSDLLATVQMPIYALDSLRIWSEAQHVEFVHHYVSRRGVDSFLRRQLVTVEQVRQRGRQIEALVQEMIAVSLVKSPDDVPGNRKSCHTWSGCPFQSRCSAFKEKPKMDLNPEELEWLNVVSGGDGTVAVSDGLDEKPSTVLPESEDTRDLKAERIADADRHAAELEHLLPVGAKDVRVEGPIASVGYTLDVLPVTEEDDPFAVFAPIASTPQEQPTPPPSCSDCGTELNAENGSQKDGKWTHVGCPARGATPASAGPKCPNCPHSAHPRAVCGAKRGRGVCRCAVPGNAAAAEVLKSGERVEATTFKGTAPAPEVHPNGPDADHPILVPHLPTCVQNDAGKWLCMEGCRARGATHLELEQQFNSLVVDARAAARERLTIDAASSQGVHIDAATCTGTVDLTPTGDPNVAALQREREMHRRTLGELEASERALKLTTERLRHMEQQSKGGSIPMLLWCPACHARHIDEGEFLEKPHHTHACQSCGLAWRPAVVATLGVQFLPGFKD